MQIYSFLISYIVSGTCLCILIHSIMHGFNLSQSILAFFLVINILICIWEICLSIYIDTIKAENDKLSEKYGKNPVDAVTKLLFQDLSVIEIFTLKTWTKIWATYALYDPSYANRESFGFFVDFGNGWVTLIPSMIFLYGMTFYGISARTMGMLGLVKFYQECYGTVMYVITYIYNRRYANRSMVECILVVGISNSLWFFFPIFGMILCCDMIRLDSYSSFRN